MTGLRGAEPAIRTPDQRLRVFVSSTLAELADERAAVAEAITALRLTPVLFELGARPHPPRELYRAYLEQSDIFVGLYWERYGWIGPDMEISGLEDEFRLSESLPRLFYVKTPAPDREDRLTAMIAMLQSEGTESYRPFATPDELGNLVRDDLALLLSERFTATPESPGEGVAPVSRSLPVPSTSLIGREQAIDEVAKLLDEPNVRLVTLTGAGGIGKTRLAIAVGERLHAGFPRGAVFLPLASISDAALVMPRIAEVLGVTVAGSGRAIDSVVERIGDTPTLLVLDNLEQVITVAAELDELLTRCPRLTILATSRTAFRLRAEREYPVNPLTVPHLVERPALELQASLPAVQLFVDRARAIRYDFELNSENSASVVEICRRLDGLPLAIELAAARVRLLDPAALLERLEGSLDALGTGPVDLPERQRTLRATVEWSIGLLSDIEREMLATLSVFVDGWTIDAAIRVADRDEVDALDLLDALAGHSLVKVEATDPGPRFRMLETVREIAAEALSGRADCNEIERRHAAYFEELVSKVEWPRDSQSDWVARLRVEEENIRRAIHWFFAHDVTPLPHMFRLLWWFWQLRDRMGEGQAWITELLRRDDTLGDTARFELLLTAAVTAIEVGDDDQALAAGREIEAFDAPVDDPVLTAWAHLSLAWIRPIEGDLDGAIEAGNRSLEGFRGLAEPFMTGSALMTVAMLEVTRGRADVARPYLEEVQKLGVHFHNSWLAAGAYVQFAVLATQEGRFDEAHSMLRSALSMADDGAMNTHTISFTLVAYAQLLVAEGKAGRAALALGAADGVRQRAGIRAWPSVRPSEALLLDWVEQELGAGFAAQFARGTTFTRQEAVDLVTEADDMPNHRTGAE
jgi:predicted ATPase